LLLRSQERARYARLSSVPTYADNVGISIFNNDRLVNGRIDMFQSAQSCLDMSLTLSEAPSMERVLSTLPNVVVPSRALASYPVVPSTNP
jgi:hypothetical protein